MSAPMKAISEPLSHVRVTRAGGITIPARMRETHGIKPGDEMRILTTPDGFQLVKDSAPSVFEAWRGIGNPDIGIGREAIQKYMREIRGYDEYDDLLG